MFGWFKRSSSKEPRYSKRNVRQAAEVGANAVRLSVEALDKIAYRHAGCYFADFVGDEPGDYRPSLYNGPDARILADAYDAAREWQGDPRRAFRGLRAA